MQVLVIFLFFSDFSEKVNPSKQASTPLGEVREWYRKVEERPICYMLNFEPKLIVDFRVMSKIRKWTIFKKKKRFEGFWLELRSMGYLERWRTSNCISPTIWGAPLKGVDSKNNMFFLFTLWYFINVLKALHRFPQIFCVVNIFPLVFLRMP